MKKADEFMSQLILPSPRPRAQEGERPPEVERREAPPGANVSKDAPTQPRPLSPEPHAFRQPRSEPDRPSLTIGQLTVEVTPPPSPPVAQGGRSPRAPIRGTQNTLPTSRRFGLGQF